MDQAKLDKKRERNRIAASKCRQRKMEKIQTLGKSSNMYLIKLKILKNYTHLKGVSFKPSRKRIEGSEVLNFQSKKFEQQSLFHWKILHDRKLKY